MKKYVLTNEQMRRADEYTIQSLGVPSLHLMERAGEAVAQKAVQMISEQAGKIVCVCGGGNNGGDGFVCARLLREKGFDVDVVLLGDKQSKDCSVNRLVFEKMGGVVRSGLDASDENVSLFVDCLFGTGFRGALLEEYAAAAERLNSWKKTGAKILSADIPSGVNGNNGCVAGVAVEATETLCIGELKMGSFFGNGLELVGKISRADIGIVLPEEDKKEYAVILDETEICDILPKRKKNSHKGTYGRAAVVAGSEKYTGAAYLASSACLRSGAGYTTLFAPKGLLPYFYWRAPELLLSPLNAGNDPAFCQKNYEKLLSYDAVAIGSGMGNGEGVLQGVRYLLEHYTGRLVIDADGINALSTLDKSELSDWFLRKKCDVVLTPHVKEFSRLSEMTISDILSNSIAAAKAFAKRYKVSVLLKNAVSVVTDGENAVLNVTGNSGQAKGGSGDVLTGVITGLCAMGASCFDGACIGAYITGRAAELASTSLGEYSLTASDVISYLGGAFLSVTD